MIRRVPSARRPHGYAMTMFLIILVVITAVTATLASTVTSSVEGARETAARTEARLLAASALEAVYANITAQPEEFAKYLKREPNSFNAPAVGSTAGTVGTFASFEPATGEAARGTATTACDTATTKDYTRDCVRITIDTTASARSVLLTAETRVDCGGAEQRCVYADFQQRLRRAQFYDYLFFNDSAALDAQTASEFDPTIPAACANTALGSVPQGSPCRNVVPAFAGPKGTNRGDVVDGAVYLRDDFLPVCGNPDFKKPVHVAGRGYRNGGTVTMWGSMEQWRGDAGCATSPAIGQAVPAPLVLRFPTPADLGLNLSGNPCVDGSLLASLPNGSVIKNAAAELTCIEPASPSGTVTLNFSPGSVDVTGAKTNGTLPYAGRLLYVTDATAATVEVQGTVSGQTTVITGGVAKITGEVLYSSPLTDAFSLVATKRILISQPSSLSETRRVRGVLVSLDSAVVVENWFVRTPGTTATLDFYGSMAGRYRSVFGGYDDAAGTQASGFIKSFQWDSRFSETDTFLKYLPRPKATGWSRLDLSEVATGK
jgi:hypothetical protein